MRQSMQSYAQIACSPSVAGQQQLTPTDSATSGVAHKNSCCSVGVLSTEDKPDTPTRQTYAHKELQNKQLLRNQKAMTVICSNVPEPTSESLKGRQAEEQNRWAEITSALGLKVLPTGLTRLSRNPSSPHLGEPRLLRVTFGNTRELEDVLLARHLLVNSSVSARIFPDRPWAERQKHKSNPSSSRQNEMKKVVLVHGVPELKHDDSSERQKHDIEEWRYIAELYDMKNVVAFDVTRLTASTNYQGSGPRIL
ncbi:unnamed protein product [Dicrocoelium dendriticum]|nr:unnamed protein product [Dicrocoelium dendriticum]